MLYGTPVVPGLGYGEVVWLDDASVPEADAGARVDPDQIPDEIQRFEEAAKAVAERLRAKSVAIVGYASDILFATAALAEDPALRDDIIGRIQEGRPAAAATLKSGEFFASQLAARGGKVADRAAEIRDLTTQIAAELRGNRTPGLPDLSETTEVVLCGRDLSPALAVGLDPQHVSALLLTDGGPTSHTSIIIRQLGIPSIVGIRDLHEIHTGDTVFVDALQGCVDTEPDPEVSRERVADYLHSEVRATANGSGQLADGVPVRLLANIQGPIGARRASERGAEGIGLLRTELTFIGSVTGPDWDIQVRNYTEVARLFPDSPVQIRTLDLGSDKQVPWLRLSAEANPALGVRGLRVSGPRPDLFQQQLDAVAAAAEQLGRELAVMAPMVTTFAEADWFVAEAHSRGLHAGVMIETPAAAIRAHAILPLLDFASIGTNDLTQYVMAADRTNPALATYTDPWNLPVLDLIQSVAAAAEHFEVPVSVCGEAAADPRLACVFVGIGIRALSMASVSLAPVHAKLAQYTLAECEAGAAAVLATNTPQQARWVAAQHFGLH
ncbi:MAG: putative PEP-binding protein [Varibaculum sp.]|nr:putative PEP-binding protein [Varibaculum sp.]